jgi:galactokinase
LSSTAATGVRSRGFAELFGREPEVKADAPGRVNLIGEHTDYSGGFVLPLAIPQRTRVELSRSAGQVVRAWSAEMEGAAQHGDKTGSEPESYRLGEETPGRGWLDYVQGITQVLALAGHRLEAFDLRLESDVPVGSGLSSSAALEISLLRGLREMFGLTLDDVEMARLGRRAENEFVGAPVGIMDQMASSLADSHTALFLDTRSLEYERVPLPSSGELAVIDSGIAHAHSGGEYRTRRREVEEAARALEVKELRDVGAEDLDRIARLPAPLDRRARHVVTENARVLAAVAAMRAGELARLGELLDESHRSLARDFEVSVPEVDRLVELARRQPGAWGARMTGGGFGGSIVVLARKGEARAVADRAAAQYRQSTGQVARVLVPEK